ncbi:MAG: hypothetical protein JKY94_17605 [Rhodobacteraceae bacterium]|nr:hypothetical protein [Paracoccaceae bacterium]
MTPKEKSLFWGTVFANAETMAKEEENYILPTVIRAKSSREWTPRHTAPGGDPLNPPPGEEAYRPIEPDSPPSPPTAIRGSEEWRAELAEKKLWNAFHYEVVTQLVRFGAGYVKASLLAMDYDLDEIRTIVTTSRKSLQQDHNSTSVDEYRAVSIARTERLFRQSDEAMDQRTALAAVKHLDRITGVTVDEAAVGLEQLADLAKIVCGGATTDTGVAHVLTQVVDAPVPPRIEVIPIEDRKKK